LEVLTRMLFDTDSCFFVDGKFWIVVVEVVISALFVVQEDDTGVAFSVLHFCCIIVEELFQVNLSVDGLSVDEFSGGEAHYFKRCGFCAISCQVSQAGFRVVEGERASVCQIAK